MSKESKVSQPYFSLDDVEEILKRQKSDAKAKKAQAAAEAEIRKNELKQDKPANTADSDIPRQQKLEAASMADILGFDPGEKKLPSFERDIESVQKKFQPYYKQLLELRQQLLSGLDLHMQDTLKRSSKDDSGDLSSYGQHLADAGTDAFDRDFALSMVSSEKEALHEIEKAIQRVLDGTYGICSITGKPISKERLKAVPFTRFSVEGQEEFERTKKRSIQRGGVFAEGVEDSSAFTDEDTED